MRGDTSEVPFLDPRIAHQIGSRELLALLPHIDQRHLDVIRLEFARYLSGLRRRAAQQSWQAAWNDFTGATPGHPGIVRFRTTHCPDCRGGVSTRNVARNLARTGHAAICGTCGGTRRGQAMTQTARYAQPPVSAHHPAQP